jgi:hypothetical protein
MRLNKVPRGRASAALLPLQASRHAHALTHRRRVVAVQSVQSSRHAPPPRAQPAVAPSSEQLASHTQ